jgi:hypothetical protein
VNLSIRPYRPKGLTTIPSTDGPEAASQTFKKGAPLVDNGSGYLAEASADVTSGIVGFAAENGHNTANAGDKSVGYYPAEAHMSFVGMLEDETNFDHVLAHTDRYAAFALQKDTSSGAWFLDENDTSNVSTRVIRFVSPVGTTKGFVEFKVLLDTTIYGT